MTPGPLDSLNKDNDRMLEVGSRIMGKTTDFHMSLKGAPNNRAEMKDEKMPEGTKKDEEKDKARE